MTLLMLLVLAVLVAAGYLLTCRIWPFAPCPQCQGAGKFRAPSGKAWRTCRRCAGSGARLRIGRRILNRWSATARKASR